MAAGSQKLSLALANWRAGRRCRRAARRSVKSIFYQKVSGHAADPKAIGYIDKSEVDSSVKVVLTLN